MQKKSLTLHLKVVVSLLSCSAISILSYFMLTSTNRFHCAIQSIGHWFWNWLLDLVMSKIIQKVKPGWFNSWCCFIQNFIGWAQCIRPSKFDFNWIEFITAGIGLHFRKIFSKIFISLSNFIQFSHTYFKTKLVCNW